MILAAVLWIFHMVLQRMRIDHKESTKGTCKASWVQIREKLSEEGLFLEDITKNGKSIFEPSSKSESASVPAEGVRSNQ